MTNRQVFLTILGGVAAVLAALLWWPQTISGRIVDGVSGEPVEQARIVVTGIVYKPLAPLIALAWGNVTTPITRVTHTDSRGRFDATFMAGIRLNAALLFMTKRGFVVAPGIEGGSGAANLHKRDFASKPTFVAWPVSQVTELEMDGATRRAPTDGRERQVQFGRAHAFWMRADARNRAAEEDPVPVSIRWVSAQIQATDSFALIAPPDGYQPNWHGTLDCKRREPTPRYFALNFDGGFFGATSVDMQSLCFGFGDIRISYRFSEEIGVRELTDEEELKLAGEITPR